MISADRWGHVEKLFGALLEMPANERERALEAVEDGELRAEVTELLSTHEELAAGDRFLEHLDPTRARSLLDEMRRENEEPRTIGPYRIVRRIGRGGMGIVYQAHDPRLDRSVALKLLPPYLNADPAAVRRLGDEARTVSALDHPNIETVYEIGEADDGRVFIAMAYYDGETLRERIERGSMPVPEVIDLGVQIAEGLSAAHRSEIIHRDIKPENILVTRDGMLKIVDFGVAKVLREGLASEGLPLGTAAYMSPEQTRGEALDHRTDIWSMGVVLYEMLAGDRPFGGEGEALIHAIRGDPPKTLSAVRHDLPPGLVTCVEGCLEKDRERRFESADALVGELLTAMTTVPVASPVPRPSPSSDRARWRPARILGTAAMAAVLLAALLLRSDARVSPPPDTEAAAPGIAVLPFEVRGEDLEVWREGMVDLLSANLDGVAGLRAIDSRTVLARWREGVQEAGAPDFERALEVARGTGARYAVTGSVVSSGSALRLSARIHSLDDGRNLASLHVEGSPDSLFAMVDQLSIDVLAAIWQGKMEPRREIDLTRITTTSLPALKAYLEGEGLLRRAEFEGSIAAYERAIAADSTFAFALYHLGLAYGWLGEGALMVQSLQRALRYGNRLPEREALLLRGTLGYHTVAPDLASAIGLLREATRRYPDDVVAWYYLGDAIFHTGEQILATRDESEKAFQNAVDLDPGFAPAYIHLLDNAFIYRPDSSRAARLIDVFQRLSPNSSFDLENRIAFGLAFGDSTRRRQAWKALDTLPLGSLGELSERFLNHPRFSVQREAVLELRPRPRTRLGPLMTFQLFDNSLSQGRIRTALAHLEDPLMFPGIRAAGLYTIHSAGLAVPGVTLDQVLALPPTDSLPADIGSTLVTFYAGAYAADRGRWDDHATAAARLRAHSDRLLSAGDSSASQFARGAALALTGQGLWRRGDHERAFSVLMDGQRRTTWVDSANRNALNDTVRWWLGELLLEMGRPQEAALYFESFWNDPLAAARLGPIYEQLGDPAKARDAYALEAFAWKDADPELQPRVQEARAAVQRLANAHR